MICRHHALFRPSQISVGVLPVTCRNAWGKTPARWRSPSQTPVCLTETVLSIDKPLDCGGKCGRRWHQLLKLNCVCDENSRDKRPR